MADLWRSVRCQRCENMSMWKCWLMICQWVFVSENISMADPVIYLELSPVQHWELWFCDNEKHVTGESQNLIAAGTWTMSLCLMQAQIVQIMIIDASNTSRQSFPSNKQFPNHNPRFCSSSHCHHHRYIQHSLADNCSKSQSLWHWTYHAASVRTAEVSESVALQHRQYLCST